MSGAELILNTHQDARIRVKLPRRRLCAQSPRPVCGCERSERLGRLNLQRECIYT